jgi:hypothetical protein
MRSLTVAVGPFVLLSLACGVPDPLEPPPVDQQAIYGGTDDVADPSVALVGGGGVWCTGTLISPKIVLTAGHCIGPTNSFVWFGSSYLGSAGTSISIASGYQTPGYAPGTHDLGILVLAGYSELPPIPLNWTPLDAGEVGQGMRLVGFGDQNPANSLMWKMDVTSTITTVDPDDVNVASGICHGDSGGPGLLNLTGHEALAGVISTTANPPGTCNGVSGTLTRVDPYVQWISDQITTNDPPSCAKDQRCVLGCQTPDPDCACAAGDVGRACTDGDPCTTNETCSANGVCSGSPKACNSPPTECRDPAGTCNFVGACDYANKPDGTSCSLGPGATCMAGVCQLVFAAMCGSANGVATATMPTANLCSVGQTIKVTGTGPWSWTCFGGGGGGNAMCTAPVLGGMADGVCGSANGVTATTAPKTGLCSGGTPSALTGSGPWTWTCQGANSAVNASCSAPVPAGFTNGACGSANGVGSVSAPASGLCGAGSASTVTNTGKWSWSCAGASGGATAQCSAPVKLPPVNGVCGTANGVATATAPVSGLCSAGFVSAVAGTGPWTWSCMGGDGGTTAQCSAPKAMMGSGDGGMSDAGPGDGGPSDAGASASDGGSGDAGSSDDGGLDDAGSGDAGAGDAGLADAGAPDAGAGDGGPSDSGSMDAGSNDAGPDGGQNATGVMGCGCTNASGASSYLAFGLMVWTAKRRGRRAP